jgi:hypothetical protein
MKKYIETQDVEMAIPAIHTLSSMAFSTALIMFW